jgi:glycosyltransferase involved in cell wall biosynthesis
MEKVTAIIPTFNEEIHIRETIESVLWCDEVLVVDSFSTDKTVEIIKSFPQVRLIQRAFDYPASQKNWAIPQATHAWIFLLDADERPTPELIEEVKQILNTGTKHAGFWILRRTSFMGRPIKYSGWQSDRVIRLFRKENCRYQDKRVHEEIESSGSIGQLRHKIIHYTYKDLSTYLKKADLYSTWGALDRYRKFQKKGKKIGALYLASRPLGRFARHYFWRLGFLDGTHGLVVSALAAYNVFIRSLKIWRLQNGEKLEDPFDKKLS